MNDICNLDSGGARRRRLLGLSLVGVALGTLAVMLALNAGREWRLLLAPPVWGAALGFLQDRGKT